MTTINDNETIELKIKAIQNLKGTEREQLIKAVSCELHSFLKTSGYTIITTEFLKTFFSEIENQRTQNKILKECVCSLLSMGKIENSYKLHNRIRFMRKDLLTFDYDSFSTLMYKNGYKQNPNTMEWIDSPISYRNQGVYSNASKSIVKCNSKYKIKAFLIL